MSQFAMIVDINGFTAMVSKSDGDIAQFVRDTLHGSIQAIEQEGSGHVVGLMGDAVLGLLDDPSAVAVTCYKIAKDIDRVCAYLSGIQQHDPDSWPFAPGGPSVKIGVEYGWIDVSDISTAFLGSQKLHIGPPINYAARIVNAGSGNRCHIGPAAAVAGLNQFPISGPYSVAGKTGEGDYSYFKLDMSEIWVEDREEFGRSYWD